MDDPGDGKPRAMIIGMGSDLRGDDAFGVIVAEHLLDVLDDQPNVTIESCQGLTPDLSMALSQVDLAVFVDSAAVGVPGEMCEQPLAISDERSMSMVHFLDPAALLAWTRRMFGLAPRGVLITVAGKSFDISETLTAPVARQVPAVIERIVELLCDSRCMNHHDIQRMERMHHA